ncbi:hypothetical protein TNCT_362291 [Trichonephila clavata]|uniref:Uncharacterized protein n=1 Tax=Trichonephila clavata TaxID=2740835 RepID=A0A8X6KMX6_TRICU|nr:hypothetical protein TNCT_362291 [Trichonephila clavata]
MASPSFHNIDLSLPHSRPCTHPADLPTTSEETPCKQMVQIMATIKRFTTTRDGYKRILKKDGNHNVDDPLYAKILNKHDKISTLLGNVVSDFSSIPRCTTIGCPLHSSHANTPIHFPKITPPGTPKSNTKRINNGFLTPPASKIARRVLLQTPDFQQVCDRSIRVNFQTNPLG